MPYETNAELPVSVRSHLPPHAQDIFREAYNHAFDRYGGDEPRAFRIAWAAVKQRYAKIDGDWIEKQ
jgi:cation transport regulator